ncbi:MAG: TIM barrel protein [Phycisphaeraceae bacterium]
MIVTKWKLSAFADEAGGSTVEQIAALQKAGIQHIDPRNVDGYNITELPLDLAEKIAADYAKAGLTVNMYGSPLGKIDLADDFAIDRKKLTHLGELSKIFGAKAVRIFSYYNKKKQAGAAEFQRASLDRLKGLIDIAEKYDLVLYHENEGAIFGEKLVNIRVLRDELRAKYPNRFKLIFDFDNYNHASEDVWTNWLELRDATDAIHLKDSKWMPGSDKPQHVPAGNGNGRIPEILADAARRGWTGPLTLEPHLTYSKAVLATGPGGEPNMDFAKLTPAESFQAAATAAIKLLKQVDRA